VITLVKHFQPHTQECTCSPNFVNHICANACCSPSPRSNVEQINVDSCDDLIAEENELEVKRLEQMVKMLEKQTKVRLSQDNRRNMVNKLEKGSNFTKQASQQSTKAQHLKRQ
jgi:hypothetical protein